MQWKYWMTYLIPLGSSGLERAWTSLGLKGALLPHPRTWEKPRCLWELALQEQHRVFLFNVKEMQGSLSMQMLHPIRFLIHPGKRHTHASLCVLRRVLISLTEPVGRHEGRQFSRKSKNAHFRLFKTTCLWKVHILLFRLKRCGLLTWYFETVRKALFIQNRFRMWWLESCLSPLHPQLQTYSHSLSYSWCSTLVNHLGALKSAVPKPHPRPIKLKFSGLGPRHQDF